MLWNIRPSTLAGTIAIPSSKSHTIRALLIYTLADGTSTIRKPLLHGDGASAINAAKCLGADIQHNGDDLIVRGIAGNFDGGSDLIDMGNSGTSTNLFMSVAAMGSRKRTFDGDSSLRSRPFRPLLSALVQLGAVHEGAPSSDLPFTIHGPINGGRVTVDGVSSQFVSSLLFACPLLDGDSEIRVLNPQEKPYIDLSLWWLDKQGIAYESSSDYTFFNISGNQRYRPVDLQIPADFSSATFAACAAAITKSRLTLTGLDFSDPQGDKGVFEVLNKIGAGVEVASSTATVTGGTLAGQTIDLNTMPDALPAMAVVACAAHGETRIINVAHARIKETDRITVMREELSKMGADITELRDGLVIRQSRLKGTRVNGHHDHRVVMALALAGMIADGETTIDTAEAAEVTYRSFVEDFQKIGADIRVE